jgi:hypothetical protein
MGASAPRVGSVRLGAPASISQSLGSSIKSFASIVGQKAWSVVPTASGAGGGGNGMTLSRYMLERARENVEYQDLLGLYYFYGRPRVCDSFNWVNDVTSPEVRWSSD